jgi:SAM-dependent methyltransferase
VNTLKESVEVVADPWKQSTYYDDAEKWTIIFWSEDHPFYPLFKRLDLTAVLELACGHGRHSEIVAKRCGQLTLMDVHEENIEYCRTRLARFQNTVFFTNSGHDFQPITDDALTAIFCYDAMVHFSPDLVEAYLRDTARVLTPGGMALYHHSNYPAPLDWHYGQNPHA